MSSESDFSWFKIISFFGAGLAALLAFASFGSCGILFRMGNGFYGFCSVISACAWIGVTIFLYKNYQKKSKTLKK